MTSTTGPHDRGCPRRWFKWWCATTLLLMTSCFTGLFFVSSSSSLRRRCVSAFQLDRVRTNRRTAGATARPRTYIPRSSDHHHYQQQQQQQERFQLSSMIQSVGGGKAAPEDDDNQNATKKKQRIMIVFDKDGTLGDCTQSMHTWSKRMTTLLRDDLLLRNDTATDRRETTSHSMTTTIQNFHTVIGWDPHTECLTEDSLLSSGTWQQILDATTNVLVEHNLEAETTALQQQQPPSDAASSRERMRTHVERLHASVGEIHADDTPVVAELATLLTELKTQLRTVYATMLDEVLFAICTSDDRRATTACLHNWNITNLIDFSVCGDEFSIEEGKPSPIPLLTLCKMAKVAPYQCIVVGDTEADTQMGRSAHAGLIVGVLTGTGTDEYLRAQGADIVIPNITYLLPSSSSTPRSTGSSSNILQDFVHNLDRAAPSNNDDLMNKVVVEFKNRIDKWDRMLELLLSYQKRTGDCNVPQHHKEENENLGVWLSTQRQAKANGILSSERIKYLNSIDMVWHVNDQKWEDMFALLVQYNTREGHCNVPMRHKEQNKNLGTWVNRQRNAKANGILSSERIRYLNSIGIAWNTKDKKWEDMFALLVQYNTREGHCNVPKRHREQNKNLGTWVKNQRAVKINGLLSNEKIKRLDSIGIAWNAIDQKWEDMFALLVQYNTREGRCNVPKRHKEENENLGTWVNRQRQAKINGVLSREKIKRLDSIDMTWNVNDQQWENFFALLVQYNVREGHCNVPYSYKEENENLGRWVSRQRAAKRKEKLDPKRRRRLDDLSIQWERQ